MAKQIFPSKKSAYIVVGFLAVLLGAALVWMTLGSWKGASADQAASEAALLGTPTPTSTKLPTPTPTETPIPTSTPLALERVPKCKDAGVVDGNVQLRADWHKGDERLFSVTRWRQRFERKKPKVIVESLITYRVRVLEANGDGYLMEWVTDDTQVRKGAEVRNLSADDLFLQDLLTLKPGLRIVYRTDSNGAYRQLENWDELLLYHSQVRDLFGLRLEQSITNKKVREAIVAAIEPIWSDRVQIEQFYTEEIQAYHRVYGLIVATTQPAYSVDLVPNVLGNFPLQAEARTRLTTYNVDTNCAFLDLKRTLAPSAMRQFLSDYLTRQAKFGTRTTTPPGEFSATRIEDNARYSIDLASSWLPLASLQRVTMVEDLSRVDAIMIADITERVSQ